MRQTLLLVGTQSGGKQIAPVSGGALKFLSISLAIMLLKGFSRMNQVLCYGATGYMGRLFAKELTKRQIQPILAGRSDAVQAVAQESGLPAAVFGLDNRAAIARNLEGVSLLVNLAGPFERTQRPLIEACLASGCHYLDIAGEVPEMQSAYAYAEQAQRAGVMLLPGAGFGVVPTDIAARKAADLVPGATQLSLLYATDGGASRGTLKTVLQSIDQPGVRRVAGALVPAMPDESRRGFTVGGKRFMAVYNPWRADLFTAGISTGIADIATYSAFPGFIIPMMHGRRLWLRDLLLKRLVRFLPEGPSEQQLQQGSTAVMAVAANEHATRSVAFTGPEAYLFTALCLVAITRRVLDGQVAVGFQTPATYDMTLLDTITPITWD
jgi:short subunit dehydrogenase-like uncharacterized protein